MKPRIVILSAFLSPLRSGAEACAEEVPLALQHQFDFTIVTARMTRSLPKRDRLQGDIPIVRVGFGFRFDKWFFPFLAPFAVRMLKPQIVHAVLESFAGLALLLCRYTAPQAKRILTCQSTNTTFLVRRMHHSPHRIVCISSVLIDRATKFGRNDARKIPNGLHLKDIPSAEKQKGTMLFAGRLRPMKGADTLLRAFAQLDSAVTLRIVGDGPERKRLEQLAHSLGLSGRVTFLGFIPVPAVYREFARAEIFCGLSRSEALGNVFLEAQAAGCAVVGTNVGGIPDVVHDGQTGLLVPPDDAEAAARALTTLLGDANVRSRLAVAGKKNAQMYDWSAIADRYALLYGELL